MYAAVINGIVVAVQVATPPDLSNQATEWVDVTVINPQPDVGWTYDGTTFAKPMNLANRDALIHRAGIALTSNQTFLGNTSPTHTQVLAQVQALTRQVDALIRLVLEEFDSQDGT